MKKIFIIFLFIIFSSSFSLAKNNEKITVEEVEDIFLNKKEYLSQFIEQWTAYSPLSKDVPENAVMVGIPAKNVGTTTEEFKPYGITPSSDK